MTARPYGRRAMPDATFPGELMSKRAALIGAAAAVALAATGCGASSPSSSSRVGRTPAADANTPEVNPAGDIPDTQAYVAYSPPGAGFSVKVPEGWSRTTAGRAV